MELTVCLLCVKLPWTGTFNLGLCRTSKYVLAENIIFILYCAVRRKTSTVLSGDLQWILIITTYTTTYICNLQILILGNCPELLKFQSISVFFQNFWRVKYYSSIYLFIALMTLWFYCQSTFFWFLFLYLFFVPWKYNRKKRSSARRCQTSKSGPSEQTCVKDPITWQIRSALINSKMFRDFTSNHA